MNQATKIKTAVTSFFTAIVGWLGILAIPVIILVIFNIIDYVTGIMASIIRKESISSYRSFKGVAKKICMWLLVVVGALMDWLIVSTFEVIGIAIPVMFAIAAFVAIWLMCTEIISIIENIKDIGAEDKIPSFLKPLAKYIKRQIEKKAKINQDGDA